MKMEKYKKEKRRKEERMKEKTKMWKKDNGNKNRKKVLSKGRKEMLNVRKRNGYLKKKGRNEEHVRKII